MKKIVSYRKHQKKGNFPNEVTLSNCRQFFILEHFGFLKLTKVDVCNE